LTFALSAAVGIVAGYGAARLAHRDPGEQFHLLMNGARVAPKPPPLPVEERVLVENGSEFNFGVMEHDETRSHTFQIRNNTDLPLGLKIIEKTCKCTIGHLPDDAIPPHETGDIVMEWTARQYETDFRQSALIETTDPVQSRITLSVVGHVIQLVSAVPPSLVFSDVTAGTETVQSMILRAFEAENFNVEQVTWLNDSTAEYFDVTFAPMTDQSSGLPAHLLAAPPKSIVECKVRLKAGMPLGTFDQRMILHTNSQRVSKMEIPVMGNVVSDVQIVGPGFDHRKRILTLGVVEASAGVSKKLRILVKGPHREGFRVDGITTEPAECLHVAAAAPQSFNNGAVIHVPLEVSIPAGCEPINRMGDRGQPSGRIVIRTSHPADREITVETRFAIMEDSGAR
jgi:hypothetical protein